jgi:2-keto-4-pentenoate hydratase/2-oxohepta-3-ene-1,7-dioic acid hydratase in catechol pathway
VAWCRISLDGQPAYGLVEGNEVAVVDAPPWAEHRQTGRRVPLVGAALLPPVEPPNFYAAGLNYGPHIDWCNRHHGTKFAAPKQADIGYRSANALVGSGADIVVPRDSTGSLEYEGELAVVIGRRAKSLTEAEALSCVAGYTLGNDVSERAWQFSDRTLWRAKNSDTFKPMGPVVVPGLDPMNLDIEVRINGRTVSSYNTRGMVFSVQQYVARMSRYLTLVPGDIIWFGCDGATIPSLQAGDLVEVHCKEIGTLANRVVREA